MNKLKIFFIIFIILLLFIISLFDKMETVKVIRSNTKVIINGKQIETDKEPIVIDGTTYIPITVISEKLNKIAYFDNENNAVVIEDNKNEEVKTAISTIKESQVKTYMKNGYELTRFINTEIYNLAIIKMPADEKIEYLKLETLNKKIKPYEFVLNSNITNRSLKLYKIINNKKKKFIFEVEQYVGYNMSGYIPYDYFINKILPLMK